MLNCTGCGRPIQTAHAWLIFFCFKIAISDLLLVTKKKEKRKSKKSQDSAPRNKNTCTKLLSKL